MVDYSEILYEEYRLDKEFAEKLISKYAKSKESKFISQIEKGISFYLNFSFMRDAGGYKGEGQNLIDQITQYKNHLMTTIQMVEKMHLNTFSFIDQHYLVNNGEFSWLNRARKRNFHDFIFELEKQIIACDDAIKELKPNLGKKGFGLEHHIVENTFKALEKYGKNQTYKLSKSQSSVLVKLLDEILYELSKNTHIGISGYIQNLSLIHI